MPSFQNERIFIIDTNTYLRIADSFHPLIEIQFGTPVCKLRVVPMLDHELKRNPRLISKFHWACSEDYIKDRRHYIKISNALKLQIEQTEGYLHAAAQQLELNTSVIDVFCLALAIEIEATLVTDDGPLTLLAKEFNARFMDSLDLLKLMVDEGRATKGEVQSAIDVIEHRNDIPVPRVFWKKYHSYFDGD